MYLYRIHPDGQCPLCDSLKVWSPYDRDYVCTNPTCPDLPEPEVEEEGPEEVCDDEKL